MGHHYLRVALQGRPLICRIEQPKRTRCLWANACQSSSSEGACTGALHGHRLPMWPVPAAHVLY